VPCDRLVGEEWVASAIASWAATPTRLPLAKKLMAGVETEVVKVGPWGGSGGIPVDVGPASRIQSILIHHGVVIDRLIVYYVVDESVHDFTIGGTGGATESKFDLGVDEYLTAMSGTVDAYQGHTVVTQLTLSTNKGKAHGPYGKGGGTPFTLPIVKGKITNFFGRGGYYVDAIGTYLAPINN
ncbi:jacalin family lectin, partial [Escherichia coli]